MRLFCCPFEGSVPRASRKDRTTKPSNRAKAGTSEKLNSEWSIASVTVTRWSAAMRPIANDSEMGKYLSREPEASSTGAVIRSSPASGESRSILSRISEGSAS